MLSSVFEKYRIIQDRLFSSDFDKFDGDDDIPELPLDFEDKQNLLDMKTKLLTFLLCFASLSVMGQGTIVREKCKTCGKVLSQCQYKGKHPAPSETNNGHKPEQKSGKKQTPSKASEPKKSKTPSKTNSKSDVKQTSNTKPNTKKTPSKTTSNTTRPSSGYENGYEWVDLGLSVKWATCNVGASTPSDYGGYYAWGETSTKSHYDWSNCFDCLDNTGDSWDTYKLGGQTRITPSSGHDTARENWGGSWRLPTEAENDELCKKCKWIWTSKNGHNGYTVTGPNGNSIFLPAAGCYGGTYSSCVGERGYYWLSTLTASFSNSTRILYFIDSDHYTNRNLFRSYGLSVRPVTE